MNFGYIRRQDKSIIKLKTLFKLDSKEKIRIWYVEVEDDKFRVVSGLQNGKHVAADWTIALPKNIGKANETTAEAQALKEAEALYEKQQAQGGYFDDVDNINNETYFEPMLAQKYNDQKNNIELAFNNGETLYASFKLDGFRNCSISSGMYTRKGKPYFSSPHISFALIPLFQKYPDIVLDGELYNHDLSDNFDKLQSLLTKKKPTAEELAETSEKVQYHVYDVFLKNDPKAIFSQRYSVLQKIRDEFFDEDQIRLVESVPCNSFEDIDAAYGIALNNSYEGQILRFDTPYENKRTKNLVKRKEFIDEEYIILDIAPGLGNWQHSAKSLLFALPNGTQFSASIKGSMEEMRELLINKEKHIGSEATIRFPNKTPSGIPRFPVVQLIHDGTRQL